MYIGIYCAECGSRKPRVDFCAQVGNVHKFFVEMFMVGGEVLPLIWLIKRCGCDPSMAAWRFTFASQMRDQLVLVCSVGILSGGDEDVTGY
jgi:hypothetical protein